MDEGARRRLHAVRACGASLALAALGLLAPAAPAHADGGAFPRPPQLEPDVQFWQRIYSKVTTQGGLLHDDRYLDVVYEELSFPAAQSPRERADAVDAARAKYERILRRLGGGPHEGLTEDEKRVLALFPANATNAALREAADRVRFQLGQADRFREGLVRAGTWERHVEETLRKEGLPAELSALPHVESSFNPRAYSKVGAAGIWQFMRSTGRRWLRVDNVVDERLDPYKSTVAAAQFLNVNYSILGSWPLALTAYNHGAGGMRRAKELMGTDDIVTIVRNYQSRSFGFASRNFYVSFLAALDIDRHPDKFFGRLERAPPDASRVVRLPYYVPAQSLERALGTDKEMLRALNLSLLEPVWSGQRFVPRGFELRVPGGTDPEQLLALLGAGDHFDGQKRDPTHRLRRGETLEKVATAFGLKPGELAAYNHLEPAEVKAGTTLKIPPLASLPAVAAPAAVVAAAPAKPGKPAKPAKTPAATPAPAPPPAPATAAAPAEESYVVRSGDTLSEIAKRFGLGEKALMAQNSIKDPNFLFEGQKLSVAKSASPASAESAGANSAEAPAAIAEARDVAAEEPRPAAESARAKPQPVSREEASELGPGLVPGIESAASADPSDYSVSGETAIVQGAETLGHFADWCGVSPARLRELNHMRPGAALTLGRRIQLDLSHVDAARFETRRARYHRQLQEDFFQRYRIAGQERYRLKSGESLWTLTQRTSVPVWLLRQYNPETDFTNVRIGTEIVLPKIEPRGAGGPGGRGP
ncbi:MAG: LysM peptidoglycan-binding domain-containing protein [Proteobacteria bacterium]|nr:LysM peptidoglycan-binding domain-containing protein [Pseudomonadota bacterium]